MALKENSKIVFNYVKEHDGENFTAADIAEATGLRPQSVNGIVTSAFQRHKNAEGVEEPLMERVPAEIELADGTHKAVKFLSLTAEGMNFDPDADAE